MTSGGMSRRNVLIASVGGQGGLTLSRVIAAAAVIQGLSVRTGETLGMSQRFGSVVSFVRVGRPGAVRSPTFGPGEADLMICLELTECARALKYLRKGSPVFAADIIKPPITASIGEHRMPGRDELIGMIAAVAGRVDVVPARDLAVEAGNRRAANMVMLGVTNASDPFLSDDSVRKAILTILPGKRGETSVKAYELGKEWVGKHSG